MRGPGAIPPREPGDEADTPEPHTVNTLLESSWNPLRIRSPAALTGALLLLLGAEPVALGHGTLREDGADDRVVARAGAPGAGLSTSGSSTSALATSALLISGPATSGPATSGPATSALDGLERRLDRLDRGLDGLERLYVERVRPVERVLTPFHEDGEWVRRIALSLVREGHATGIDPRVLASVLLVENPWLDPDVESSAGAVGLMQVMPLHAGGWGCGSDDLTHVETNVCHGARIFAYLLADRGDLDRALLAYNGCVHGTNTPDCHLYPSHVYSRAGRVAMWRWLDRE